jgi:polyferredoxin
VVLWLPGENYAKILQILNYVIAAGCAVLVPISFLRDLLIMDARRGNMLEAFLAFLAWVLVLAVIAAALLLSLLAVAAILLAVDSARNIRAMKKATATTKNPK